MGFLQLLVLVVALAFAPSDDAADLPPARLLLDGRRDLLAGFFELVEVSPERSSGFPKLMLFGSRAVLAWTDAVNASLQVRTLVVDIEAME